MRKRATTTTAAATVTYRFGNLFFQIQSDSHVRTESGRGNVQFASVFDLLNLWGGEKRHMSRPFSLEHFNKADGVYRCQ